MAFFQRVIVSLALLASLFSGQLARAELSLTDAQTARMTALLRACAKSPESCRAALGDQEQADEVALIWDKTCIGLAVEDCLTNGRSLSYGYGGADGILNLRDVFASGCTEGRAAQCLMPGSVALAGNKFEEAEQYFKKACAGDLVSGCRIQAIVNLTQRDAGEDALPFAGIYEVMDKACALGGPAACEEKTEILAMYDKSAAIADYKSRCTKLESAACLYVVELVKPEDFEASFLPQPEELFTKYCDADLQMSDQGYVCQKAITAAETIGLDLFDNLSAPYLKSACLSGQGKFCYDAGDAFFTGNGVEEDLSTALTLFIEGCKYDDLSACHDAGYMYDWGKGTPEDNERAAEFLELACLKGNSQSCHDLAYFYSRKPTAFERLSGIRKGPPYDLAEAYERYERTCMQRGYGESCIEAVELALGHPDDIRAKFDTYGLLETGCFLEEMDSCLKLHEIHGEDALKWLEQQCGNTLEIACEALKEIR